MIAIEVEKDIECIVADAMVYSTNQSLHLSGGVGACLVKRFGYEVQSVLDRYLRVNEIDSVAVGTVIEGRANDMPWKRVFHTVATDVDYNTEAATVESIITYVLETCEADYSINSIVFSALGSGYGSLQYEEFLGILNRILVPYSNETFEVYVAKKI